MAMEFRIQMNRESPAFNFAYITQLEQILQPQTQMQTETTISEMEVEQFEDAVGWRLSACMDPPEKVVEDLSIDGLQWLCRELRIDWRRAL